MPSFMRPVVREIMSYIKDGEEVVYAKTDEKSGEKAYKTDEGFLVHEDWTEVIEDNNKKILPTEDSFFDEED